MLEDMLTGLKKTVQIGLIVGTLATAGYGCKNPFSPSDDCDVNNGGKPSISFTYVPKVGSHEYVKGEIKNVDPDDHKVSLYIKVGRSWWMKPYWSRPLSSINDCGEFSIDYTTGGIDSKASTINAYLVTKDFEPKYHTLPNVDDPKVLAVTSKKR